MNSYDLIIIGGGIVGLATGYRHGQSYPQRSLLLVEKEIELATHQTGHNSGVLHSGIYYRPGSRKASNCSEGRQAMIQFCRQEEIAHDLCGKVIVAVDSSELPALDRIFERGQANQVRCEQIDRKRLMELEPHAAGIRAIHVPDAGIVDYRQVCQRLAHRICEQGGEIELGSRVTAIRSQQTEAIVETTTGEFRARQVINCAGLHSDRVVRLAGAAPTARIVPFRGEYYQLRPEARELVRHLIYPVPDPAFPFLGVHFTRMIDDRVECGPNAVLAFAREGYTKLTINPRDLVESLGYPGFLKLALRHWRMGMGEMWRSVSKRAFVKALAKLLPEIRAADLDPAPAGVRAQALQRDGQLVDDFLTQVDGPVIHVVNAPSPAATAAFGIGSQIVELLRWR
jgi:(S)-2-hydroxyglutarate dehydrogenase